MRRGNERPHSRAGSRAVSGYANYPEMKAMMDVARKNREDLAGMERELAETTKRTRIDDKDLNEALDTARNALEKAKKSMVDVAAVIWGWMAERERGFLSSDNGERRTRLSAVADRVAAHIQENLDALNDAAKAVEGMPGVAKSEVWDASWDGKKGVIDVSLPVEEWRGEYPPSEKVPMSFGADPIAVASRVGAQLRRMGLRVTGMRLPEKLKGLMGGFKGYDIGSIRLNVALPV